MAERGGGYAFNVTRQAFLATDLTVAKTHWGRLKGLIGVSQKQFRAGRGLWIVPCRGVHTLAMRCPVDVIYLDSAHQVVHVEENMRPWRIAPIRFDAASVLELPAHSVWTTGTAVGDAVEIAVIGNGMRSHAKAHA